LPFLDRDVCSACYSQICTLIDIFKSHKLNEAHPIHTGGKMAMHRDRTTA